MRRLLLLALLVTVPACSKDDAGTPTSPSAPAGALTVSADDLAFCVSESNRYRAMAGVPPLAASSALETSAATAAQADHLSGVPHGWVRASGQPLAENQSPRVPLASVGRTARGLITRGLSLIWAEGPGGGHYEILRSTRYTQLGCGIYSDASTATFVQHFR
jgi:uncharacterized protein YkwD